MGFALPLLYLEASEAVVVLEDREGSGEAQVLPDLLVPLSPVPSLIEGRVESLVNDGKVPSGSDETS